jgi:hypothetical protein
LSETDIYILISAVLGFLVGFFAEFLLGLLQTHYNEYRDRVVQKRVLRGDLRARLRNFRNSWEDRDCIIPATDMRKDLISVMKDIREGLNDELSQLHEEEKTAIRKATNDFLKVAGKFPNDDDAIWSDKVKNEMEEICKNIKEILEKLA